MDDMKNKNPMDDLEEKDDVTNQNIENQDISGDVQKKGGRVADEDIKAPTQSEEDMDMNLDQ